MKAIRVLILFSLILMLSSCSLFQSAYDVASEHVEVTWKKDKDKEQVIVDSIVIRFNPVYWREPVIIENDTVMINEEIDRKQDGYQIWILETNTLRYNEVRKLDTVIYIYRNKR